MLQKILSRTNSILKTLCTMIKQDSSRKENTVHETQVIIHGTVYKENEAQKQQIISVDAEKIFVKIQPPRVQSVAY